MLARTMRSGILVVTLLTSLSGVSDAPDTTSVWSVLEQLLAQDSVVPDLPAGETSTPERREFLFDRAIRLSPDAIMRGAAFILAKNAQPAAPGEEPARARRIDAQLLALFEYYPLIAREHKDAQRILDAIVDGSQPPEIRAWLLRQCVRDATPYSAFGDYLQVWLARGDTAFEADLAAIVQNPTEFPPVQFEALRVLPDVLINGCNATLARDPEAAAYRDSSGAALRVQALVANPEAFPISRPSQLKLEERAFSAGSIAAIMLAATDDPARSPELRAQAAKSAARILNEIPVPNRAELLARGKQRPPVVPNDIPAP